MPKVFRLFVSATFVDFEEERSALRERVFPVLRDLCRVRGAVFQPIDLRWGVSRDAAAAQRTMQICLEEIDRSVAATARPNFLILLGDRYGKRLAPERIPGAEYRMLLAALDVDPESDAASFVNGWYALDENAIEPEYRLLPRGSAAARGRSWPEAQERLVGLLGAATDRSPMDPARRRLYKASATELEAIHRGLLEGTGPGEALCMLRTIEGLPDDMATFASTDPEARGMLAGLKSDLRARNPEASIIEYRTSWTEDGPSPDRLDSFCAQVESWMTEVLRAELAEVEDDVLASEIGAHSNFAASRRTGFMGRTGSLEALDQYVAGPAAQPFVVQGPGGAGKSALLAQFLDGRRDPDLLTVSRFIGAVPGSENIVDLLTSLCRQLRRVSNRDEAAAPTSFPDLVEDFQRLLDSTSRDQTVVIVIDAVDQLYEDASAASLAWVPVTLPSHVRMVLSTTPGPWLE